MTVTKMYSAMPYIGLWIEILETDPNGTTRKLGAIHDPDAARRIVTLLNLYGLTDEQVPDTVDGAA